MLSTDFSLRFTLQLNTMGIVHKAIKNGVCQGWVWDSVKPGSSDNGAEYVPMFDPPPAHPSLAHPWPDSTPYTCPGLVLDESQFEERKPKPKPTVKKPEPEYTDAPPPPIDWDLYKCQGCGQILAGFARYEHVRDMHKGVDPGFEKFMES